LHYLFLKDHGNQISYRKKEKLETPENISNEIEYLELFIEELWLYDI